MINLIEYKAWFASLKMNNKYKLALINEVKSEKEIFLNKEKLIRINQKNLKELGKPLDNLIASRILDDVEKGYYSIVTYLDNDYPKKLRKIDNPPYVLFYKGDIKPLNSRESLAIIGSRKCTNYGLECAKYIAEEVGKRGVNIISGGALGIDSAAHKACVKNNFYTASVLGCGINVCYPSYNKELYDKISKNGVVITEFLPDTKPLAFNFPQRNRIISGLSKGVIVAEAGEKSGSSITVNFALEQGKDVIAIPGSIFSKQSVGVNRLIKDGAFIFTTIEDMFYNMKLEWTENNSIKCKGLKANILKLLEEKPMHIDEIIRSINVDTSIIYELLFEMQFDNKIINLSGNYYAKII